MKKSGKLSPKEKRQREQERRRQTWKEAAPSVRETESAAAKPDAVAVTAAAGQKNKSPAKAAGVKSTFTLADGKLLMTTFGDGNKALLEKRVEERDVFSLAESADKPRLSAYDAAVNAPVLDIRGANGIQAHPADPRCTAPDRTGNLIASKAELEQRFFGRTFGDNIHIQLIYNILDVEKILGIYINSIIYELNNIYHRHAESAAEMENDTRLYDLFESLGNMKKGFKDYGAFSKDKKTPLYRAFHDLIALPQLVYYPDAFHNRVEVSVKGRKQLKLERKPKEELYYILSLLGMTRQAMAHSEAAEAFYQINQPVGKKDSKYDMYALLDSLYQKRVDDLDAGFLDKARTDLAILFGAMGAETPEAKQRIVGRYYDFIVRKAQKNFGFSTKKLRERIVNMKDAAGNPHPLVLDDEKKPLTDDRKYSSVRGKMYKAIDFLIYCHYRDNQEETDSFNKAADAARKRKSIREQLVEGLRRAVTETEKEAIYAAEAKRLWKEIRPAVMERIVPFMRGQEIQNIQKKIKADPSYPGVTDDMLTDKISKDEKVTRFSKLMSLLTLFLDGKEINDLLSTLVNKFENIASLLTVLEKAKSLYPEQHDDGLLKAYKMFNNSAKIAEQLNAIRSFARMRQPEPGAKRIMFVEAAQLLGDSGSEEELTAYWDEKLSKDNDAGVKRDNGFRNFIASNVISSARFQYLIRYSSPRQARKLAENSKLVSFVLKDIPDTQIARYYGNTWDGKGSEAHSPDDMRKYLVGRITGLNFRNFENVNQAANVENDTPDAKDKQRKQAVIRLYLAVLYLIAKNLVYVNSRYFTAFQIQERDMALKFPGQKLNYLEAAEKAMESVRPTRRVRHIQERNRRYAELHGLSPEDTMDNTVLRFSRKWLAQDLRNAQECGNEIIRLYRNQVEHLNAIRCAGRYAGDIREITSWYALYHYIMQRILRDVYTANAEKRPDNYPVSERLAGYFAAVDQYGTYCKDFVKALNIPFGYNLPRYKNLSVDCLFDKNRPGVPGCGKDKNRD